MTSANAIREFRRIIADELPKVKVRLNKNKEWVKATKKDTDLSRKLSKRLNELFQIFKCEL